VFDFGFERALVGVHRLLEQVALCRREGFALHAVAQPLQVGEFQGEGLDLGFGVLEAGFEASGFGRLPRGLGALLRGFGGLLVQAGAEFFQRGPGEVRGRLNGDAVGGPEHGRILPGRCLGKPLVARLPTVSFG